MLMRHNPGFYLSFSLLLLAGFSSCKEKEEEDKVQKEPTILQVNGSTTASAVVRSLEFSVRCDARWSAELEGADWAAIESQTALADGGSIVLRFDCNRSGEDRTGTLVISSGSKSVRKSITQSSLDKFFMPTEIHLAGVSEVPLVFDSPAAWTVSIAEGEDWILIGATEGASGYAKVPVKAVDPNENIGDRSGSLTVTIGSEAFTIPVLQSQKDVILADNTQVDFAYKGGDFAVITQSNVSYQIECEADWVHHNETKALNQATELFTVDRNETLSERTAVIRFTPVDGTASSVDVKVRQDSDINTVDLGSTSGSVSCTLGGSVKNLEANSTSGAVSLKVAGAAEEVKAGSTSGSIYPDLASVNKAEFGSTSGCFSGSVRAFRELKIHTTSGKVDVKLPTEPGFTCKVDSASGDLTTALSLTKDGNKYTCGDGSAQCSIDTTSGDITLSKLD